MHLALPMLKQTTIIFFSRASKAPDTSAVQSYLEDDDAVD